MKLRIEITGIKDMEAPLAKVCSPDARKAVLQAAGEELKSMAERNFRNERYRPAPWPPLAPSTIAAFSPSRRQAEMRRQKLATARGKPTPAHRPLIDTGTLMRSLVLSAADDGIVLESDRTYANYHQFGTKNMPARPFVPVTGDFGGEQIPTAEAEKRMLRAAEAALRVAAQKAGFSP